MFGHRFVILDTDDYVLKYMESNAAQYSPEALLSIQNRVRKHEAPAPELEKYVCPSRVQFAFGTYKILRKYFWIKWMANHILDFQISLTKWKLLDVHRRLPKSTIVSRNLELYQLHLLSK